MKDTAKYILVGAGAAAAVVTASAAAAWCVSEALLRLALDRKEPKLVCRNREKLAGSAQWQQYAMQLEEAALQLRRLGTERIQIIARDGTPLVGHWQEQPGAERVVIAMHGWRSAWDQDFGLIAPFLHQCGCNVLYCEQRGQQESGGDAITFGLLERWDCLDWLQWVQQQTKLPVYLAGISMGATTVLLAAGEAAPGAIRGVIADCGYTAPHAIWQHVAERNLHLRYDLCSRWVRRLCRKRLLDDLGSVSTLSAMEKCTAPVLFIHGTEDTFVPVEMTYQNYLACKAPKQLLIVPGAGHGMSYLCDPIRYRREVLTLWQNQG